VCPRRQLPTTDHRVTTRLIAEKAGANISMIRYYFGNKEGLCTKLFGPVANRASRLSAAFVLPWVCSWWRNQCV